MTTKNLMHGYYAVLLTLPLVISQSCSDDQEINPTGQISNPQTLNTGVASSALVQEETYFSDPAKVLEVLRGNSYYVFFNDDFGPQQIAVIKFGIPSRNNPNPVTWIEQEGSFGGTVSVSEDGKASLVFNFGDTRRLTFGLVRVVDTYADPTKTFDVYFDKTQLVSSGGLEYNIDNVKYFDQLDLDSRDAQEPVLKPLENTKWLNVNPLDSTAYKFAADNTFNALFYGLGQVSGTYTQESGIFITRVSFVDPLFNVFAIQIVNKDNASNQLLSVEKRNGVISPVKKLNRDLSL